MSQGRKSLITHAVGAGDTSSTRATVEWLTKTTFQGASTGVFRTLADGSVVAQ
jgi:hypothetical protein